MLEWKAFFRSASFGTNLVFKVLFAIGAIWIILSFASLGAGLFFVLKENMAADPLFMVNSFLIYFFVMDLIVRYFFQKMPTMNIRPLLYQPLKKGKVANYAVGKTVLSYFNIVHAFFFIPFSLVLLKEGYEPSAVLGWHLGVMGIIYINNFINVLVNNKDLLLYIILGVLAVLGFAQYQGWFDATDYTGPVFQAFYKSPYLAVIPWAVVLSLYFVVWNFFKQNLYLDTGLAKRVDVASSEDFGWLDRFGSLSTFLKNDIKLIQRNKRSRTTVLVSVMFLFYGLLFFTDAIEAYENPTWRIFAGIFVSGGFLFTFGQFVPSWDSSYYPLMMSQNILYRDYLRSKWYLVIIATVISTILASFYLYFGWEVYLAILVGAVYNIGVNAHLVLWGGAYIKTPIDLTSSKNAFGNRQAFNLKSMLLTLPKLFLPMVFYSIGHYALGPNFGFALVALAGILGLAFRDKVFSKIEHIYKTQKYETLRAYKEKN